MEFNVPLLGMLKDTSGTYEVSIVLIRVDYLNGEQCSFVCRADAFSIRTSIYYLKRFGLINLGLFRLVES